jgi:hypothetical protein
MIPAPAGITQDQPNFGKADAVIDWAPENEWLRDGSRHHSAVSR